MVRHERVWPAGFKDAAEVRNSSELVPPSPPPTQEQTTTLTTVSTYHLEMRRRVSGATDLAPLTQQRCHHSCVFPLHFGHKPLNLGLGGPRPLWVSGFFLAHTQSAPVFFLLSTNHTLLPLVHDSFTANIMCVQITCSVFTQWFLLFNTSLPISTVFFLTQTQFAVIH